MSEHSVPRVAVAALLVVVLAACSATGAASEPLAGTSAPGESLEPVESVAPSATPDFEHPVGLIAIGHSGLTGEGAGATFQPAPENSWPTGTNPDVNSIYLRLVAERPETEGHVANAAVGGAVSRTLAEQASQALAIVPAPALAIISTIDNDITCDGGDAAHVAVLGDNVRAAIEAILAASPHTKVLVLDQGGRPSPEFIEELVAHDPAVKAAMTGSGMCDFYSPDGTLNLEGFETLTGIIEAYEAEQARVCAEFENCQTDGGVRAAFIDRLEYFAADWGHANLQGQAAQAELMWPVVVELLGL